VNGATHNLEEKWTRLARFAPGLPALLGYRRQDLPYDVVAGLSVAAVALPVGVAYAQLAGFGPEVGLYASILPLVVYALFGTSRQLIIGPDAATCAIIAAVIAPLAGGDRSLYLSLSLALAMLAGVFCIVAGLLRLGAMADFLSKPILVGFLNGVAISIVLGQIGKVFGFSLAAGGILPRLLELLVKLNLTHWPTLVVGIGTYLVLIVSPRWLPRVPAALVAMALAALAVRLFGLDALGVQTIGDVPAGLPHLRLPIVPVHLLPALIAGAGGLALVSFSSMMLTARSFASKNRYDIDTDREFVALGVANIAAGVSQGFAVSGADSRTAMNDAAGGRTRVAGLVAAAAIAVVLLFFTGPLRYLPVAALGAVLMKAAVSLFDQSSLRLIYKIDPREFALSIIATLGVVAVGAVPAILVTIVLAIIRFVRVVSRPRVELLGEIPGLDGLHSLARHPGAEPVPGLLLFRFNAPIVFFNAPYFKRELLAAVDAAGPGLHWVVLDMVPITMVDATGLYTFQEILAAVTERGLTLATAGRETEWREWAEGRQLTAAMTEFRMFAALTEAVDSYRLQMLGCADVELIAEASMPS
jgi:high affinity sulfate transporter 1